jgi:hypothetical protein
MSGNFNVEISSGRKERTISKLFAEAIVGEAQFIDHLKDITISGDFDKIYFKATKSSTITNDSWTSLHLELPPELRLPRGCDSIRPSPRAYRFADCITTAIRKVCT